MKVRTIVNLPFGCLDRDANDRANFAAKIEKVVCIKAARLRTEVLQQSYETERIHVYYRTSTARQPQQC